MTRWIVALAVVLLLGGGGAAWWVVASADPVTVDAIGDSVQTRARSRLPVFADNDDLATLYRFAVDNPDVLRYMPCTCGCGTLGHGSNRACYVKAETADRVTYTSHAAT